MTSIPQQAVRNVNGPPITEPNDADALLVAFLRGRDVACPRCAYNLRDLARPVCPECEEPLRLHVTAYKPHLAWLLLTLAPGAFCAIAFVIFVALCIVFGPPRGDIEVAISVCFIFVSGLAAIVLAALSRRFMRLSAGAQGLWAIVTWAIHLLAFGLFIAFIS